MSQIFSVPSPVAEIKTAGATQAVDIVSPDNFTWRISVKVHNLVVKIWSYNSKVRKRSNFSLEELHQLLIYTRAVPNLYK